MKTDSHQQILVQVKAPVDVELAELVEVLNEFPYLYTVNSCQGQPDGEFWVDFRFGKSLTDASIFLAWFSRQMVVCKARVSAEWGGGATHVLSIRGSRPLLPHILVETKTALKIFRSLLCSCDTAHTRSRNCLIHHSHQLYRTPCGLPANLADRLVRDLHS